MSAKATLEYDFKKKKKKTVYGENIIKEEEVMEHEAAKKKKDFGMREAARSTVRKNFNEKKEAALESHNKHMDTSFFTIIITT